MRSGRGHDRGRCTGAVGIKDITHRRTPTAQSLILDPAWATRRRARGQTSPGGRQRDPRQETTMEFACGMPDDTKPFPCPQPWDTTTLARRVELGDRQRRRPACSSGPRHRHGGASVPCGLLRDQRPQAHVGCPKSGCHARYTYDHIGPMARAPRTAHSCSPSWRATTFRSMCSPRTLVDAFVRAGSTAFASASTDIQARVPVDPALPGCLDDAVAALADAGHHHRRRHPDYRGAERLHHVRLAGEAFAPTATICRPLEATAATRQVMAPVRSSREPTTSRPSGAGWIAAWLRVRVL